MGFGLGWGVDTRIMGRFRVCGLGFILERAQKQISGGNDRKKGDGKGTVFGQAVAGTSLGVLGRGWERTASLRRVRNIMPAPKRTLPRAATWALDIVWPK